MKGRLKKIFSFRIWYACLSGDFQPRIALEKIKDLMACCSSRKALIRGFNLLN